MNNSRLLPSLLLAACINANEADRELTTVCVAYDQLRVVAKADTMTAESADQQTDADEICGAMAIPTPHK